MHISLAFFSSMITLQEFYDTFRLHYILVLEEFFESFCTIAEWKKIWSGGFFWQITPLFIYFFLHCCCSNISLHVSAGPFLESKNNRFRTKLHVYLYRPLSCSLLGGRCHTHSITISLHIDLDSMQLPISLLPF